MAYGPPSKFTENELAISNKVIEYTKNLGILVRFKTRDTKDNRRILAVKKAGYLDMCSVSIKGNSCRVRFLRHKELLSKNIRSWFIELKAYTLNTPDSVCADNDIIQIAKDIVTHLTDPQCFENNVQVKIPVVATKSEVTTTSVYGGFIESLEYSGDKHELITVKIPNESILITKTSIQMTINNLKVGNFFCVNTKGEACAMSTRQVNNYFDLSSIM